MSASDGKCCCENGKEEKKKEESLEPKLKTTTKTSASFYLTKFNAKDYVYHEERLPKNFRDLENLLNKILINLDETENVFMNQARAVLERDLILINWRIRLKKLRKNLEEKKEDFERIDQTVQCIFKLSSHIDSILEGLEKELPGSSLIDNAFKYAPTRMNMYDSMMTLNVIQKDFLQQLSNAALRINEAIECNPSDPVEQLTRILSLHVEVLRTIERRTGKVDEQLSLVKALHEFYTNAKKPMMCDYF